MNVKTFNATLTSKGQITLPKTVRDILALEAGDQVSFTVQPNNQVVMEKYVDSTKYQVMLNLIYLLLKHNYPIFVEGGSGVGKTYFIQQLLKLRFSDKKVVVIQPIIDEYKSLFDYIKQLDVFVTSNLDNVIPEVMEKTYDVLVIDEAQRYDFESIKKLKNHKLILISQKFKLTDLINIGTHFLITIKSDGILIDFNEVVNGIIKNDLIYV